MLYFSPFDDGGDKAKSYPVVLMKWGILLTSEMDNSCLEQKESAYLRSADVRINKSPERKAS